MTHTPPTEAINDSPTVCVQINKQWVSHVMGRLQALTQSWFWSGDEETVYDVTQEAEKLMLALALGSEACMTPIGSIVTYPVNSTVSDPPEGWLFCNGSPALIADYPDLFALLGTLFGNPDPGVSFGIPDLRGKFILGQSFAFPAFSSGGTPTVVLTTSQIPPHTHDILARSGAVAGSNVRLMQAGAGTAATSPTESVGGSGTPAAAQPHENMPPYFTLNYIIRAR